MRNKLQGSRIQNSPIDEHIPADIRGDVIEAAEKVKIKYFKDDPGVMVLDCLRGMADKINEE